MKDKKYPFIIIASIIFMFIACIYTVYLSFDYPVDEDESYFRKYQDVENNFTQIKNNEREFLQYFKINIKGEKEKLNITKRPALLIKNNEIIFYVKELKDLKASDLKTRAKLTRPHTKHEDKAVAIKYKDNTFIADLGELKDGRWTLLISFNINNLNKFYKLELCKNKCKA